MREENDQDRGDVRGHRLIVGPLMKGGHAQDEDRADDHAAPGQRLLLGPIFVRASSRHFFELSHLAVDVAIADLRVRSFLLLSLYLFLFLVSFVHLFSRLPFSPDIFIRRQLIDEKQ